MSILENLYYGKVYPAENIHPKSPEHRDVVKRIDTEFKLWENKLTKEDFTKLEDLCGLLAESSSIEMQDAFCYGFKLATTILFETFSGKDELIRE